MELLSNQENIFLKKLYFPKKVIPTVPKKEPCSSSLSGNNVIQCNIKIIFKFRNHLFSFFRFTNVMSRELQSHIVYKVLFGSCSGTYYGKTKRHLKVRSSEYLGISHLTRRRVECKPSAVSNYLQHNHDINLMTLLSILR